MSDQPETTTKTTYRDLFQALSAEERIQKGAALVAAMARRNQLDATRKAAAAQMKVCDAEIAELSAVIHQGQELRPVKCEARFDWTRGTCEIWRVDGESAEFVEARGITTEERQGSLDLDEGGA
jgi:hypothetical protein